MTSHHFVVNSSDQLKTSQFLDKWSSQLNTLNKIHSFLASSLSLHRKGVRRRVESQSSCVLVFHNFLHPPHHDSLFRLCWTSASIVFYLFLSLLISALTDGMNTSPFSLCGFIFFSFQCHWFFHFTLWNWASSFLLDSATFFFSGNTAPFMCVPTSMRFHGIFSPLGFSIVQYQTSHCETKSVVSPKYQSTIGSSRIPTLSCGHHWCPSTGSHQTKPITEPLSSVLVCIFYRDHISPPFFDPCFEGRNKELCVFLFIIIGCHSYLPSHTPGGGGALDLL